MLEHPDDPLNEDAADHTRAETFEQLIDWYTKRLRSGERPSIDHLAGLYPAWADEVREVFPALVLLERTPGPDTSGGTGQAVRPPRFEPGVLLAGRYKVSALIGRGGMGEVYQGRDETLGRDVAIKCLTARRSMPDGSLKRFEREAKTLAALSHPNVLTLFDFGEVDGLPFIVMEFLDGMDLSVLINQQPMAEERVLEIARGIALGLSAAHESGVVHHDIKPHNVIVRGDGLVKVVDFGLARLQEGGASLGAPAIEPGGSAHPGTLAYMSPEQVQGGQVSTASDLFSFGIVLFEMATGVNPFRSTSASGTIRNITGPDPPAPGDHSGKISPDLQQLIKDLLSHDPSSRPDAGQALQRISGMIAAGENQRGQFSRRGILQYAAAGVGLAALSVASYHYATRSGQAVASPDPDLLRLSIKPWIGYAPLVVAQKMGLCGPVRLAFSTVGGLEEARRLLDKREIDIASWLVDTHVLARASGIDTQVALMLDISLQADAVIARSGVRTFHDLRGKAVTYQYKEASHFLLLALCEEHGVDPKDLDLVATTAKGATDLFIKDDAIAAAASYDPHLSLAESRVPGSHRLASGADVPGAIIDILTVRSDVLRERREQVGHFLRGWFEAVDRLSDPDHADHEHAVEIVCRDFYGAYAPKPDGALYTPADFAAMTAGMRFGNLERNLDFFRVRDGTSEFRERFAHAQQRWATQNQMGPPTRAADGDGSEILYELFGSDPALVSA